jgi:hypothetical protein
MWPSAKPSNAGFRLLELVPELGYLFQWKDDSPPWTKTAGASFVSSRSRRNNFSGLRLLTLLLIESAQTGVSLEPLVAAAATVRSTL